MPQLPPTAQARLDAMYAEAATRKPAFDSAIAEIATRFGGEARLVPLKGRARAEAKILTDYAGEPSRIQDLLRATIIAPDLDRARQILAALEQRFAVLAQGRRNLLDPAITPEDGYRDAKVNVGLDGHVAEIQVSIPEMLAAKTLAHSYYEERQALLRTTADGRDLSPEDVARVDTLLVAMRQIYSAAWSQVARNARNSASEMGAPLRYAESAGNGRGSGPSNARVMYDGPTQTGIPSTSKNREPGGNPNSVDMATSSSFPEDRGGETDEPQLNPCPNIGPNEPDYD
ncbi:hypothetical protein [Phaeospirillum tilakii]|uniref:RelA/SpoT domain-containing protein n=1 Tax=Phaeospirillum tilakii TaxID=741673 RepID=A0ABW5C7F5_9PROT